MPPLTHAEARERAQLITVTDMHIRLDLCRQTGGCPTFESETTITFTAVDGASTFVDFRGRRLQAATLNGEPVEDTAWADGRIRLTGLRAENTLTIAGEMDYSHDGEGLHRHVDPADDKIYLYAMSFLDAAPRWFACFDQPDLKAPYVLNVAAPASWTVHGNGPAERVDHDPDGGTACWRIVQQHRLASYFVTLVAGEYASIYRDLGPVRAGIHVRASLADELAAEADDIFTVTGKSLDYYRDTFDRAYPFGEYHQAFVPDFNAGAMENPGCVTFRDSFIYRSRATRAQRATRAGVIAHEMAHQWFGDLVTMRWWDDLWLNESFAEYLGHQCCTDIGDYPLWTEFGIDRKNWGYVQDQSPNTHPVAGNGAADAQTALSNFDGISYAKGAAVLRQLAAYLGDAIFIGGLRRYIALHAFGNASFADLVDCWIAAGAQDLPDWTAQWLRTAGLDTLRVRRHGDGYTVERQTPLERPAQRRHVIGVAELTGDAGLEECQRVVVGETPARVTPTDQAVTVLSDVADQTWAKIRFDTSDWQLVTERLSGIPSAPARTVIWNSLQDQVRDAELDPATAIQTICDHAVFETEDVIVQTLLGFAAGPLAGRFTPLACRGERLAQVHHLAQTIAASAPAGSDRQLIGFRTAIHTSHDPAQLDRWRQRRDLPAGLDLDPDLVWTLVTRLCTLDDRSAVIDETLAQDRTAAAHVHAARARAALPTPEAKHAAYRILTRPSDLPAYQIYATAEAMFPASAVQVVLTRPYAQTFFDDVAETAAFRSGWLLNRVPLLAFPSAVTERDILSRAEAAARRTDLPQPLARAFADGADQLGRGLAAIERFGHVR